jgi:hypothetical protein
MSQASIQQIERVHRCAKHPDKIQYRTTAEAFDVADRRAPLEGVSLYVYVCDHCGYFHLSKKRGTEDIGRMIASRHDGKIWESSTANPHNAEIIRDERFVDTTPGGKFRADVAAAIRSHGSPDIVHAVEVCNWLGLGVDGWHRKKVRGALSDLGWVATGKTAAQSWHRQLTTITDVEIAPAETAPAETASPSPADVAARIAQQVETDSPWKILEPAEIADMTVDQLARFVAVAGMRLRIMIRQDSA